MRVAFFVWEFPIISETFVLNMARTVLEKGHDLDIRTLMPAPSGGGALHPIVGRYDLLSRRRVDAIPASAIARMAAAPGAFIRLARRIGLGRTLRLTPLLTWSRDALSLRLLLMGGALGGARYDILHCQFTSLADRVRRLREAGAVTGGFVVHVRGADVTRRDGRVSAYGEIFAAADAVIANSVHFRDAAITIGCPADKIVVIPSAIDLDSFPFRAPTPPEGRRVRLLSVGRLVEKKGFRFAIDMVARLVAEGRDVALDIIGAGGLEHELAAQIAALGLQDRIRLLGARPSDFVQAALQQADIFIAASVTASDGDQDAATNTVKEAMATGAPVVATRHGGMPEMIVDGETGVLVAEGDAAALAAGVSQLLDAPERWAAVARRARAKVESEAARPVVDARLMDVYRLVAKSAQQKAAA